MIGIWVYFRQVVITTSFCVCPSNNSCSWINGAKKFIYNFSSLSSLSFRCEKWQQKWQEHWPHSQAIYLRMKTTKCQQQWCCEDGINCARRRSQEMKMSVSATSRLNEQSSKISISNWIILVVGLGRVAEKCQRRKVNIIVSQNNCKLDRIGNKIPWTAKEGTNRMVLKPKLM